MTDQPDDGRRMVRNVRISDELADWLQDQARKRGVGVSPVIEDALRLLRGTQP